ncbi:MAG: hypothetical protein KGL39_35540, partial [Patescibacteria group bacterium]|nr:hypothetical protein [Patescibacteria group bacterium]
TAGAVKFKITFSTTPAFFWALGGEFSGILTSASTDGSKSASISSSTAYASTSFTTTAPGDLIIHVALKDGTIPGFDTSVTANAGYNFALVNLADVYAVEYTVQGTAGPTNPSMTWAGSDSGKSLTAAFKASAGAGTPPPTTPYIRTWCQFDTLNTNTAPKTQIPILASGDVGVLGWHGFGSANGNAVTAASESGSTCTLTTSAAHDIVVGDPIVVIGMTPNGYNGVFTAISGTTGSTVKYANSVTGLGAGTAFGGVGVCPVPASVSDGTNSWTRRAVGGDTESGGNTNVTSGSDLWDFQYSSTGNPVVAVTFNTPAKSASSGSPIYAVVANSTGFTAGAGVTMGSQPSGGSNNPNITVAPTTSSCIITHGDQDIGTMTGIDSPGTSRIFLVPFFSTQNGGQTLWTTDRMAGVVLGANGSTNISFNGTKTPGGQSGVGFYYLASAAYAAPILPTSLPACFVGVPWQLGAPWRTPVSLARPYFSLFGPVPYIISAVGGCVAGSSAGATAGYVWVVSGGAAGGGVGTGALSNSGGGGMAGGAPASAAAAYAPAPSGGGVSGPSAAAPSAYAPVQSGGAASGPPASEAAAYTPAPSGGGLAGPGADVATGSHLITIQAQGGGVSGPPAGAATAYSAAGSGGGAGGSQGSSALADSGQGGAIVGPPADAGGSIHLAGQGGTLAGPGAGLVFAFSPLIVGGMAGGSRADGAVAFAPSGGAAAGSQADTPAARLYGGQGGASAGPGASTSWAFAPAPSAPSGGATAGAPADVIGTGNNAYVLAGAGGAAAGSAAAAASGYVWAGSGGGVSGPPADATFRILVSAAYLTGFVYVTPNLQAQVFARPYLTGLVEV